MVWALSWLGACASPGSVELTGLDAFGDVRSAAWMVEESETATEHRLLLASGEGACAAWQEAALLLSTLESGPREDCAAFQEAMSQVGAILDGVVGAGATTVELSLSGAPSEGTWSTADPDGEDLGPIFEGSLRRWVENPYTWAATGYDCDDPDPIAEYTSELVEVDPLEPATLTLERVAAHALEGGLEGRVSSDDDGDLVELGTVSASATWSRCTLDAHEDPVLDGH